MEHFIGTALQSVEQFVRVVRPADILDVVLVGLFLYGLIAVLRASVSVSTSRSAIIVGALLVAAYVGARFLELYLLQTLIQFLLVVLTLVVVVVFQTEIRRFIDRLGSLEFFRSSQRKGLEAQIADTLVATAKRLAETNTGALIALRGQEPWDRHIEGGVELGGELSQPLLLSLFNPAAPTHDGAVLLEEGEIERFGAHLPLSSHLAPVKDHGTRHSAGLGLSEACDAFVIIVSEETGAISVVERGNFEELSTLGELKSRLEDFHQRVSSGELHPELCWWKRRRIQNALLAIVLSISLWFMFAYRTGTVYRTFTVPIELRNLPQGLRVQQPVPAEITITLAGTEHGFRILNMKNLIISFDLSDIEKGATELEVKSENLKLPGNLRLYRVAPEKMLIHARPAETQKTEEGDGEE